MVAVGGFSGVWSVLFGVTFITTITEPLQELGYLDVVVYGLLLVVISIKFPNGLLLGLNDIAQAGWRRLAECYPQDGPPLGQARMAADDVAERRVRARLPE